MERGVMPKETVQGTFSNYDVQVGWGPTSVQVGVESAAGLSLVTVLYGSEDARTRIANETLTAVREYGQAQTGAPADLGRRILDIVESSGDSARGYTGVWSRLDRAGLNRLIKLLRRARDAAYGRDE